jgi:AraC family transcriptional regulator
MAPSNRTYGDAISHSFGIRQAPALTTRALRSAQIGLTHLTIREANNGRTPIVPAEDSFIIAVYLTPVRHHELWSRGKRFLSQPYATNAMRIVNLEGEFAAQASDPHETIYFYMPRSALNGFADEEELKRPATLTCEAGLIDPVMANLVRAALPSFQAPEASALFIDHLTLAMCAHVTQRFGGHQPRKLTSGGLSNMQESRAKAYLSAHFNNDVSIANVAEACGLSRGHFTRAFRQSTGTSPYRWLLQYRLDQAKTLLAQTAMPIAEIAIECGFSDQTQLTRAFSKEVGVPPGFWRRHLSE